MRISVVVDFKTRKVPGTWERKGDSLVFTRTVPAPWPEIKPERVWKAFHKVTPGNLEELIEFLNWSGRWDQGGPFEIGSFWKERDDLRVAFDQSRERQALAMFQSKVHLIMRSGPLHGPDEKVPSLIIHAETTKHVLWIGALADLQRDCSFRYCARPTCPDHSFRDGFPFQPTSGHQTKYCSYDCAHAEAQRAQRDKKKRGKHAKKTKKA